MSQGVEGAVTEGSDECFPLHVYSRVFVTEMSNSVIVVSSAILPTLEICKCLKITSLFVR